MFEHAAGDQPDVEFLVGRFGRRFVGHGDDPRLAVLVAVEVDALARLDVGIEAFAIAPLRFLAVDDGPSQAPHLVIGVERCEIVAMAAAELGVFLEQAFLHVEAEGLRFAVFVLGGNFAYAANLSTLPLRNRTSNSVLPR